MAEKGNLAESDEVAGISGVLVTLLIAAVLISPWYNPAGFQGVVATAGIWLFLFPLVAYIVAQSPLVEGDFY